MLDANLPHLETDPGAAMDILFALPVVLAEHPLPVAVGLIGLALAAANRYGAWPTFPWRVPASRITPRTPEQEASDTQRIADLRIATRQIRQQFADDGDGRRVVHPIVTFEREKQVLTNTQRRIRVQQKERAQ